MTITIRSSLLAAVAVAASVYSSPVSTNPHYIPQRSPLTLAPLHEEALHGHLNNSYLISLKHDLPIHLVDNHFNFLQAAHSSDPLTGDNSGLRHVYDTHTFKGYAGHFTDDVIAQIRRLPEVEFVERDQIVHTMEMPTLQDTAVQKGAPWGLARISHRARLTFSTFTKYEYEPSGGEGVDVYVIDTGINVDHVEFEGRASWGKTIPQNDVDEDGNGHGSHCAGTIASAKYGVAKKANVIAVKVLGSNGSGSMSDVVAGVDFAVGAAKAKAAAAIAEVKATGKTNHKGSVANMSLGGGKSPTLDRAVNAAVDAGVHFAVAAGNENTDACSSSPARAEKPITVGASTLSDERAYFSNYGKCVDVFAPGLNILSTYKGGPNSVATLSGTSMASPHVAGLAAYLLSIYPSVTFNPESSSILAPIELSNGQRPFSLYSFAVAALPRFISEFLPSPAVLDAVTGNNVAPIPKVPTLTPDELKAEIVKLSSSDLLTDIPKDTVNLLVFNNATS